MKFVSIVAPLVIVCSGCAAELSGADDETGTINQELGSTQSAVNPAGTYTARVTANGTGCPAGTWEPRISADGKLLTVRFGGYSAMVQPGQGFAIKDCALSVALETRSGQSFAFSSLSSYGSAFMDPAVSVKASARHYVRGGPAAAPWTTSANLFGVKDRFVQYRVDETFADRDRVWSACGTGAVLVVNTRLVLLNDAGKTGWGYAGELPDDAESPPVEVVIGLARRAC